MVKKRILFLDGEFLPADKSLETFLAPTKVGGTGVFETLLSRDGKVFFLKEHLSRLRRGTGYFKIKLPFSPQKIAHAVQRVVTLNKCSPARVRLLVWKDQGCVHTAITACPAKPLSQSKYRSGFKALIAGPRCRAGIRTAEVKSLEYQPYMQAYQQAAAQGYDEALLLNTSGELAEGSRTNIFFVRDGKLFIPALSCGCLNGIVRQLVLRLARQEKIPYQEGRFKPDLLKKASEAFITNSMIGVIPLVNVNGQSIGRGKRGPVTEKLMKAYQKSLR